MHCMMSRGHTHHHVTHNIMSRIALKKGVEEPWTMERGLLGYREITLKSDKESATIASRKSCGQKCAKKKSQQKMQ